MPPDDRLGTVHWVVKGFVELAANAGIVGVLVSLENRGGNMHGHAALHVGWIKRQVVDLQHQLGQGEEPDLLGGRALGQQELYDARGSDFMVRSNIERWQRFSFFRAAQELEQACHDLHRYEKSQTGKFFGGKS